jgi:hypothetical protein
MVLALPRLFSYIFLAAMRSSRSDDVTLFVRPFVRPKPYFFFFPKPIKPKNVPIYRSFPIP